MKKGMKKILLAVMVITTTAALFGCGGGKVSDPSTVVVGIVDDIDSLDLHNAVGAGTRGVLFNIFEGLVKLNSSGELEPAVASSYTISDDAKVYTFELRDEITFHDGSLVTVEDIKYSIQRYAEIALGQSAVSAFSILNEVAIIDDKTVEVRLKEGNTEFLSELTCAIMPESNDTNAGTNPIGTGPFKFVSFAPGESLIVEKYDGYWNEGYPKVDRVEFKKVSDTNTAITQLQAGTLDISPYLTVDQANTLSNDFNILEDSVNMVQGLYLNNKFEPFSDVKVRQAFCYAVDRDYINEQLTGGKSHILGTHMINTYGKYYNVETETVYEKNIGKAKELLAAAGYENGFDLTITVPSAWEIHIQTAEIIVEQLKEIGINAKLNIIDFETWKSEVFVNRNYEATVIAVDANTVAPHVWFEKNVSTGSSDFTNYNNPEFDTLYEKAFKSIDEAEKVDLYNQMQMILATDAASVYIQNPANLFAMNKDLTGYEFYPTSAMDMSKISFVK